MNLFGPDGWADDLGVEDVDPALPALRVRPPGNPRTDLPPVGTTRRDSRPEQVVLLCGPLPPLDRGAQRLAPAVEALSRVAPDEARDCNKIIKREASAGERGRGRKKKDRLTSNPVLPKETDSLLELRVLLRRPERP